MSTVQLIFRELWHRKPNFLMSLLAIVSAVALFVCFFTGGISSNRETIRLMRDLGYNLRIIPKATDMEAFYLQGFSNLTMPEENATIFGAQQGLSYAHLLATLHQRINWQGKEIVLTGLAAKEVAPPDKKVPMMFYSIEPGQAIVGYEIARALNLHKNDRIDINGVSLTVTNCLNEQGTIEDIRIYANLKDVQTASGMEGKINEIQALDCMCVVPGQDPLDILRAELTTVLPDTQVVRAKVIAETRWAQRTMQEQNFIYLTPFVLAVCAIWIGSLAMLNTRERRQEIGVLRALGYGSGKIAMLFIGKAIVIGILGALVGYAIGTVLAVRIGPTIFKVTAHAIKPMYDLLVYSLFLAPLFSALSCFIPAMLAVTQDPAETLREE